MTWYAQQLIADASPPLLAALKAHPVLSRGLYHVKDLAGERRTEIETVAVMITPDGPRDETALIDRGPLLPPGGLVFVRELCDLDDEDDSHMREWFGDDAIAWTVAPDAAAPALAVDRAAVADRLGGDGPLPPIALLREAKRLSIAHAATISWYSTFFWGGDQEVALAWVFDPGAQLEVVYTHHQDTDRRGGGDDAWAWRLDPHGARRITQGDVLSLALVHHGLMICHRFVPHQRSFPWADHRV